MNVTKSILYNVDMEGCQSSGIDHITGESLPLDFCDQMYIDVIFEFKKGRCINLGTDGRFTTYLIIDDTQDEYEEDEYEDDTHTQDDYEDEYEDDTHTQDILKFILTTSGEDDIEYD